MRTLRACAESVPVDFIISRDGKAFARSFIKRLSAQDYINLFCEVEEVHLYVQPENSHRIRGDASLLSDIVRFV